MSQWYKKWFEIIKRAVICFLEDKVPRLAAALSYYTLFSLAPTLIIAIALVGIFIDENHAQTEVINEAGDLMGAEAAALVSQMLNNAPSWEENWTGAWISLGALIFGASNVFAQLQGALNTIWGVDEQQISSIKTIARKRIFAFLMLLLVGAMLLVALFVNAALSLLDNWIQGQFPEFYILISIVHLLLFIGLMVLLFGLLYKVLPDASIRWHDVWAGAIVAALLFAAGRWAIGFYVASRTTPGAFGTASAMVVILIWIYFSAQFFLFGAEFAQAYANHRGREIRARWYSNSKPQPEA